MSHRFRVPAAFGTAPPDLAHTATMAFQAMDVERPLSSSIEPWYRKFYDSFDYPAVRVGAAEGAEMALPPSHPRVRVICRIPRSPPRAQDKCLHDLFAEQADRTPHRPCIVDPRRDTSYTFAEVDRLTDEIAEWLVSHGCGPDMVG